MSIDASLEAMLEHEARGRPEELPPSLAGRNPGGGVVSAPNAARSFKRGALTVRRWIEKKIVAGVELGARWWVYEADFRRVCGLLGVDADLELGKHEAAAKREQRRRRARTKGRGKR